MKHVVIALSIALLVFPFAAGAHAGDAGDAGTGFGMMSWGAMGSGGFWPLLLLFAGIVWLVVGILAIVWLSRQINKK